MLWDELMWIINDFPTYDMLFGWFTIKRLACPICMEDIRVFIMKHRGKQSWFDCHRCFLDIDHVYRRNKYAFYKNKVNKSPLPCRLTGDEMWQKALMIVKVT